jgi:hypothetical protein
MGSGPGLGAGISKIRALTDAGVDVHSGTIGGLIPAPKRQDRISTMTIRPVALIADTAVQGMGRIAGYS